MSAAHAIVTATRGFVSGARALVDADPVTTEAGPGLLVASHGSLEAARTLFEGTSASGSGDPVRSIGSEGLRQAALMSL